MVFVLIFISSCAGSHKGHSGHAHHHRFNDAQKWAKVFEKEERKEWQKPRQVIEALSLKANSLVADIGAGTGYFPVRVAKKVPRGKVWAMDIEPNLIRFLFNRKEKESIKNLYPILGSMKDPLLPERVDVIMMVDTYHHIAHRPRYFSQLKKYLKPSGRIVIIDFKKGDLPVGPKDKMKISQEEVIKEMREAGYQLSNMEGFLPYQFMLTFK